MTFKSTLEVSHPVNFSTFSTSLKSTNQRISFCCWQYGSVVIYFNEHSELQKKRWCITVVQGRSRSLKLLPVKSRCGISCYSSTVTVCVSSVISEIYNNLVVESLLFFLFLLIPV